MNKSKYWLEKLYEFVDHHPEGVREKDIKEEFEGKGKMSHSTFVKHWKNLKDSGKIVRALGDDGSIRYYTRVYISQTGNERSKLSIIRSFLSAIIPVAFFVLIWLNMRTDVHHAVNMSSTLTATHRQVILLAIETYPYILTLVAIFPFLALLLRTLKYPNYSASSLR
jgi:hypothetical protein